MVKGHIQFQVIFSVSPFLSNKLRNSILGQWGIYAFLDNCVSQYVILGLITITDDWEEIFIHFGSSHSAQDLVGVPRPFDE